MKVKQKQDHSSVIPGMMGVGSLLCGNDTVLGLAALLCQNSKVSSSWGRGGGGGGKGVRRSEEGGGG